MIRSARPNASRGLSRRQLLCGAAATAAFAPFVPLRESEAQAAAPQRFFTWFTGNGTIRDEWTPGGGVTDFRLKRILAPLEQHRDNLLIVSGMAFNPQGPGGSHQQGAHLLFSGSYLNSGEFEGGSGAAGWGTSISVDQIYANALDGETPFGSLVIGVQPTHTDMRGRMSYTGDSQPVVPVLNPAELFDRLFSTLQEPAEQTRLRAQRRSVLDLVATELGQLRPRYSVADGAKIDSHLDAVRSIERRLDATPLDCSPGEAPGEIDLDDHASSPLIGKLFMDMLLAAFSCDLTRTGSFMWGGATSRQRFPWLDINEQHHTLSHVDSEDEPIEQLIQINEWYSQQMDYFLSRLGEIEEGGGTALDNTLLLAGSEIGRGGSHTQRRIPIYLAGGAGGKLQMGRHIDATDELTNRLLVSILHTLGLEEHQTFGNTDTGSGPLTLL